MTGPVDLDRRRFLLGAGTAAASVVLGACGGGGDDAGGAASTAPPVGDQTTTTEDGPGGEVPAWFVLVEVERAAIAAFEQLRSSVDTGALGQVPPVVSEVLATALAEHQLGLDFWLERITVAELEAPTEPNGDLAATAGGAVAAAVDGPGVLRAVREIATITGDTYLNAAAVFVGRETIVVAAELAALDVARVGVVNLLLGEPALPSATHASTVGFDVPGQ